MMNKSLYIKAFSALGILLAVFPQLALTAYAGGPVVNLGDGLTCSDISGLFQSVINLMVVAAGVVFFVMMVLGGFMYMTSAGNPDGAQKAQQTLVWGAIGTLITLFMVFIATTLLQDILGVSGPSNILNVDQWICG